jgi:hypothetical protein
MGYEIVSAFQAGRKSWGWKMPCFTDRVHNPAVAVGPENPEKHGFWGTFLAKRGSLKNRSSTVSGATRCLQACAVFARSGQEQAS